MILRKIVAFVMLLVLSSLSSQGNEYPDTITIKCDKIKVQLSKHVCWNINKIWYKEYNIGESTGYWGTTFAIPSMSGFIGGGHITKEGQKEDVITLKLFADGKHISPDQAQNPVIECKEFSLKKRAKVKDITFVYTLIVKNNKLYESCELQTAKDQRLMVMYNFMQTWNRKLTDYYVQVNKDKSASGTFMADASFPYEGPMQWITLYDTLNNIGIVSKTSGAPSTIRLWDRVGNKKIYPQALKDDTMNAGEVYSYSMQTSFYRASPTGWQDKAKNVAANMIVESFNEGKATSDPGAGKDEYIVEKSFPEFRKKAANLTPYSPADFALGSELLKEIRTLAKKRKSMFGRPMVFARSQPYRSGRLYYCRYVWVDRPLFASRMLWEPGKSDYKDISFRKTLELFDRYGLDGYSSFVFPYARTMRGIYKAATDLKLNPEKFHILLGITPGGVYSQIDDRSLDLFINSPYSLRFNEKNIAVSYVTDRHTPEKVAESLKKLEKRSKGKEIMLVSQIHYGNIRKGWRVSRLSDPYDLYLKHGSVPATLLLHHLDYLSKYLRVSGGLDMGAIYNNADLTLNYEYYNKVAIPLYAAAIAQDEFNGKKLLCNRVEVGYTSYHGAQTLSRDGTKTLRGFLDIGIENNLDIMMGTEWDELNEDTNFEPTVAKPMATQRIVKYYMSKLRKEEPVPNPGDDLSLPNMIISQRRQSAYGWAVDVELLNVPDTNSGKPYSVILELLNQNDDVVFKSNEVDFNTAKLKDHTVKLPSENFASCRLLQPRLTINYNGKKRIVSEGLPFTIMRATTSGDHTYFNTPLRNILFSESSEIKFEDTGKILAPNVKQLELNASLKFADELSAIEVVQDSREIYAYDPQDEYLRNDPERVLYKFSYAYINNPNRIFVTVKTSISNAPSAKTFTTPSDPLNKAFENPTIKVSAVEAFSEKTTTPIPVNHWVGGELISIEKKDIDKAVLTITGIRTSGQNKDEKFEWQIPIRDIGKYGVKSKIFEDGLMLALQTQYRPTIVPLPLNSSSAKFKTMLVADEPNGVMAVRAVSKNGKVYWSKGFTVNNNESDIKIPIQVYSEDRGAVTLSVSKNRVPAIKYEFTPQYGNILTTTAGREFYGHAGGFLSTAIAFKGLVHSRASIPQSYYEYQKTNGINKSAPIWVKQADGKWALYFDGKHGNFLALPNTAVPHRAGFTMAFELKPEVVKSEQIIFAQYGIYLTGFRLSVVDGKFNIEFNRWTPFRKGTRITTVEFASQVPLFANKWQTVIFKYDEKQVTISANGKTESFPCEGISRWLTISSFGGSGAFSKKGERLYYQGLLRSLEIKHTASQ